MLIGAADLPTNDHWRLNVDGHRVTTSVPAAARFRPDADDIAEKVFNRVFVKTYLAPPRALPVSFLNEFALDPHQVDGVNWILTRSRSYLAHAPGAGKTLQAIVAAYKTPGRGHALVIVPPSLTANWVREIERFGATLDPGAWPTVAVIPESKHQESAGWRADWIVCPDSMLAKPWVLKNLIPIRKRIVIVDEASRFKEPTSQRTIALFGGILKGNVRSPGLVQDARHAVLMDGSPMPNRPMELWAPTYAMAPEVIEFMGEQDFGFRYCGAALNDWGQWEFRHASNEFELKARLQKSFMHVVGEERLNHPERRRSILTMSEDPRSPEYKTWERKFLNTADFSQLTESKSQGELATRRRELGESKIPWIARYVRERMESKDESILLFAWHREVCQRLYRELMDLRPALIIGGTAPYSREIWFNSFQKGSCKLIIGNIASMGRGHNLQRADRIVFGEFSWTDELNKQCEKRASRRGRDQASFVRCDYVVAPNSMDEVVLRSVFGKARTVERVIG